MRVNGISIVLLFLLGISSTCSRYTQINPEGFQPLRTEMSLKKFSSSCKSFIKTEVRHKWLLHTSHDCYFNNQSFWENTIARKSCFVGKSKKQVRSIFGTPSDTFKLKQSWDIYHMGEKCEKYFPYFSLQFHYNEEEVLKNIAIGQITYD